MTKTVYIVEGRSIGGIEFERFETESEPKAIRHLFDLWLRHGIGDIAMERVTSNAITHLDPEPAPETPETDSDAAQERYEAVAAVLALLREDLVCFDSSEMIHALRRMEEAYQEP